MRNPRRMHLTAEMIEKHQLSTDPPPPDSLFWTMWNAAAPIARQALETPFVQGIRAGTLDPVQYGGFNVNDAYYCYSGAGDYAAAAGRAADPTLKAFLLAKHHGYEKYNATFPTTWRVRDPGSIVPFDACHQYAEFESRVASQEDPIYSLVVMLPCEYLWAWLGAQLAPPAPGNLYAPWITGNDDPHGAYAMGNFLEEYRAEHPHAVDPEKATRIYTRAMDYERQNFAAAVSQAAA
jgi:thiaminase (transcriptional activator TenA)